jgi:hypothetical protein
MAVSSQRFISIAGPTLQCNTLDYRFVTFTSERMNTPTINTANHV